MPAPGLAMNPPQPAVAEASLLSEQTARSLRGNIVHVFRKHFAVLMTCVTALSVPIVTLAPHAFERLVDRIARRATASTASLVSFVVILFLIPTLLIAW